MKKRHVILLISISLLLIISVSCASTVNCDAYGQTVTPIKTKNES